MSNPRSGSRIRVVFFDVHDTLIYCKLSPPEIFVQLCQQAEVPVSLPAVEQLYASPATLKDQRSLHKGQDDEFWLRFNAQLLDQLKISDPHGKFAQRLMEGFKDVRWWDVYSDVKPTLNDLQGKGYALAVIANARSLVEERLAHLRLTGYFQTITYSQEVGFEKPDPRLFQIAMKRMQCRPEEAVHIGDRDVEDVQGAQGVGMRAILIDRKDSYPHFEGERVRSLKEIPKQLRPDG